MVFYAVLLLLIAMILEAGSAMATALLVRRGWMPWIPHFTPAQIDYYFAHRNPLLGWGPPVDSAGGVVALQPRSDPAFPQTAPACASAYGESFTAGAEVGNDATYPHVLGQIVGCRVANYGVGAYGSDQAWMLARAQHHLDNAPVVILGHTSENILRNVNQYRNLLYPGEKLFFKPRFILEGDSLRRVPIPIERPEDFERLERDPAAVLPYDAFLSRPRPGFPQSLTVLRWATRDFHVRAHLKGTPRHEPFYHPDHPAGGLQLTSRILTSFAREAREDGRFPFVVLLPLGRDFQYALRTGRWPDQPLADALRRAGVPLIHAGPPMLIRLKAEDPCHLFHDCSAHYNDRGYRLLAEVVAERVSSTVKGVGASRSMDLGSDQRELGPF